MSWYAHHALIVTCTQREYADRAHAEAARVLSTFERDVGASLDPPAAGLLSPISDSVVNRGGSFFAIFPDGSSEGWPDSDEGDRCRAEIIRWLDDQAYDDGSTAYKYVLVRFGEDDCVPPRIEASNSNTNDVRRCPTCGSAHRDERLIPTPQDSDYRNGTFNDPDYDPKFSNPCTDPWHDNTPERP